MGIKGSVEKHSKVRGRTGGDIGWLRVTFMISPTHLHVRVRPVGVHRTCRCVSEVFRELPAAHALLGGSSQAADSKLFTTFVLCGRSPVLTAAC